jgi:hypothetical protein
MSVGGTLVYFLIALVVNRTPDPVVVPILSLMVGSSLSFYLSGHIANGAAAKALDTVIAQNASRAAIFAASRRDDPPPAPPAQTVGS